MIRKVALSVVLASILGASAAGAADKPAPTDKPAPAAKAAAKPAGDKAAGEKDAKAKPKMMSTTPEGKSISDSPYASGPPAVTGGFTDTTQGGTHTSGDYPVAPQMPH